MRAVLQRVHRASVTVDGEVVGAIEGLGILALIGVARGDGMAQVDTIVRKIAELRMFDNEASVSDVGGSVLVVSQFTLYGDTRKGRRPSWSHAAPGSEAEPLVEAVVAGLRQRGLHVETGRFGAMMDVALVNSGPFTLLVEA
ncbi:D-aminoacyl-tRNA deacylase [Schaalia suimastitidis]|uniref:D-aminoacyl-tRNA deacylase n=1 Tax=Schaalia suimastitidis TaxID=121163 RepID=UPI00047E1892|nr:D-aminoacyl-tRNA deacylase [Schaalia suimastitidis]